MTSVWDSLSITSYAVTAAGTAAEAMGFRYCVVGIMANGHHNVRALFVSVYDAEAFAKVMNKTSICVGPTHAPSTTKGVTP